MDMPKVLNPGPIASRISFFAPVSLLFFFAVFLIFGAVTGMNLHPMNYFFLAAGFFAFQLLFAYTVDLMPIHMCFFLSAAVSLGLVCGYLHAVGGRQLTRIALPAQFAYMVLFSYSFFFDGLSGLTIAVGAVLTLAVLMVATAKLNWSEVLVARKCSRETSSMMPGVVVDN
jgi:inner membrane protein involved in colicin E2 resistance